MSTASHIGNRWQPARPGIPSALIRLVALALLVGPLLFPQHIPLWPGMFALSAVWLTAFSKRTVFRRNLERLPRLTRETAESAEPLAFPRAAIIAAGRNEEEGIDAAARSLAAVDYPELEIHIVNDHSTDGTGAILEHLGSELPQLRIHHNPPLQQGWLGKANAVWYAVGQTAADVEWLVLTDADVVFAPEALRAAIAIAERDRLDFLTCIPFLETGSLSEELVLPFHWHNLMVGCRAPRAGSPTTRPVGIGAFNMVRKKAYLESGGHSAFPNRQPEDALLAETVQAWGGRLGAAWTSDLLRVRLYRGYNQLRRFWVRKNRVSGQDRPWYFVSMALLTVLLGIVPLPLFVAHVTRLWTDGFSITSAFCALLAGSTYWMMATAVRDARAICRLRPVIAWLHPIGGLLRLQIDLCSLWNALLRRPMDWRGRDFSATSHR